MSCMNSEKASNLACGNAWHSSGPSLFSSEICIIALAQQGERSGIPELNISDFKKKVHDDYFLTLK